MGRFIVFLAFLFSGVCSAEVLTNYVITDYKGGVSAVKTIAGMDRQSFENYSSYGDSRNNSGVEFGDSNAGFLGASASGTENLSLLGSRYYREDLGMFLTPDPVTASDGGLRHLYPYGYSYGDPINQVDTDGELPFLIPIVVFVAKEGAMMAFSEMTGVELPTIKNLSKKAISVAIRSQNKQMANSMRTAAKDAEVDSVANNKVTKGGPLANGGNAKPHGNGNHNSAIDNRIGELKQDPSVSNIRKNQQQVDVNGNKVGTNRPDIQYDQGGCHHCVEYDHVPRNSTRHGDQIIANDPNVKVELNLL